MSRSGLWLVACLCIGLTSSCARRGVVKEVPYVPPPAQIPQAPGPKDTAAPNPTVYYLVREGDSLWRISRHLLGNGEAYRSLAAANHVPHPDLIQPGLILRLPRGAAAEAIKPVGKKGRKNPKGTAPAATQAGFPKKVNHAFGVGERLKFAVQYLGITAGYATLSLPDYLMQNGRPCLHVVAEAKTQVLFDPVFKVRDRLETFVDFDYLVPWRFEKHVQEGGFRTNATYLYDQDRHHAVAVEDHGKDVTVPAQVQDELSCFYSYRTLPLQPGSDDWIPVVADDMNNYQVEVKVLRHEHVKVLAGEFDCIVVEPVYKFAGVFQHKGKVLIWLTDDDRHVPVMIKAKIFIGSIDIILQEASLPDL
jgi:hypothetical protein